MTVLLDVAFHVLPAVPAVHAYPHEFRPFSQVRPLVESAHGDTQELRHLG